MSLLKAVFQDKGFFVHAIVYGGVNLLLAVINLLTNPQSLWFLWPLLGWGLGLIGHGAAIAWKKRKVVRPAPR